MFFSFFYFSFFFFILPFIFIAALVSGTVTKDQLFDTLDCVDALRIKYEAMLAIQKDVVLTNLSKEYEILRIQELTCYVIKYKKMLKTIYPNLLLIENKHRHEKVMYTSLHNQMNSCIAIQVNVFSSMESVVEGLRDLDLDVMSLYEQELDGWKTIAFEGPMSSKGKKLREKVKKTRNRRIQKEMLKEEQSKLFNGTISKGTWKTIVNATAGVVGRILKAPKVYKINVEEVMEEKEEEVVEEKLSFFIEEEEKETKENANDTVVDEAKEKNGTFSGVASDVTNVVEWTAEFGLEQYRKQYLIRQETLVALTGIIEKRKRQQKFS